MPGPALRLNVGVRCSVASCPSRIDRFQCRSSCKRRPQPGARRVRRATAHLDPGENRIARGGEHAAASVCSRPSRSQVMINRSSSLSDMRNLLWRFSGASLQTNTAQPNLQHALNPPTYQMCAAFAAKLRVAVPAKSQLPSIPVYLDRESRCTGSGRLCAGIVYPDVPFERGAHC
jgi:hypothetical protein